MTKFLRIQDSTGITRRSMLRGLSGIAAMAADASIAPAAPDVPLRSHLGLVIYCCNFQRRHRRRQVPGFDLFEPLNFLKHCRKLGAGGMQVRLATMSGESAQGLREYAERNDFFIEGIVTPPQDDADKDRFEAELKTAKAVGATVVRTTIIPGRRYERFNTLAEFRAFEERGREMLQRAAPIAEKQRVRLAVENHKDQRLDERIALFENLDSEFVGACLDTGNSISLLDGIYEPIEALAPYAFTVHLKDQALSPYGDGFLLADVPLGQGSLDLKRIVSVIRTAKPNLRFSLELITRDPLKVPCLTEAFWRTLPKVPASDLAKTLRFVRSHQALGQSISGRSPSEQATIEQSNVMVSLEYAGEELGL